MTATTELLTQPQDGYLCTPLPPSIRLVIQASADMLSAVTRSHGWPHTPGPLRALSVGTRTTFALGPTEWILLDTTVRQAPLSPVDAPAPYSLVDVSHRQVALRITGPSSTDRLSSLCPLDLRLESFPVNGCTRTVLGRCEMLLWRVDETAWQVDVWRSFAHYVRGLLATPF